MATNQHEATCEVCTGRVRPREGHLRRQKGQWVVRHVACESGAPDPSLTTLPATGQPLRPRAAAAAPRPLTEGQIATFAALARNGTPIREASWRARRNLPPEGTLGVRRSAFREAEAVRERTLCALAGFAVPLYDRDLLDLDVDPMWEPLVAGCMVRALATADDAAHDAWAAARAERVAARPARQVRLKGEVIPVLTRPRRPRAASSLPLGPWAEFL